GDTGLAAAYNQGIYTVLFHHNVYILPEYRTGPGSNFNGPRPDMPIRKVRPGLCTPACVGIWQVHILPTYRGNQSPRLTQFGLRPSPVHRVYRYNLDSSSGITVNKSPTKPISATSKMGASSSSLTATMVPASLIPARC